MANLLKLRWGSQSVSHSWLLKSGVMWSDRSQQWERRRYGKAAEGDKRRAKVAIEEDDDDEEQMFISSGLSKPLSEILKQLNKKVPDSLVKLRFDSGLSTKYIPWHVVNRIMNLHASEWSGEIRSVSYSPDGKSVSVVYRVTLYGTDAEIYRESTGSATLDDTTYGDPVQKAEAMAFRRACARFGLGLHLYHEDLL